MKKDYFMHEEEGNTTHYSQGGDLKPNQNGLPSDVGNGCFSN